MTVQLSSLRVDVSADSSSYQAAMAGVTAANNNAAASSQRVADAQGKFIDSQGNVTTLTNTAVTGYGKQSAALLALQRSLDPAFASASKFESQQALLTKGLDTGQISLARFNELLDLSAAKYGQNSATSKAFQTALSGVSGQLIALSSGAGPVGVFLSALSPWGLAASIAMGGVSAAFAALSESALKVGQSAIEANKFLQATGLAADQFSALKRAAGEFGITGDDVAQRIERFTTQFEALNQATGGLYQSVLKINPTLAAQMVAARSAGEEINLLAAAIANASTQAQKSEIANAAFGRGGVAFIPALTAVSRGGGLDALKPEGGEASQQLLQARAKITAEIQRNNDAAEKFKASITADAVLDVMLKQSQASLAIAKGLKDAADEAQRLNGSGLMGWFNQAMGAEAPAFAPPQLSDRDKGLQTLRAGQGTQLGDYPPGMGLYGGGGVPLPQARPQPVDMTSTINQFKAYAGAMGAAVTPAETLKNKQDELQKAWTDGVFAAHNAATATTDFARAQGILKESFGVDQLRAMISALGAAATPAEQYKVTVASLHLELDKGQISQSTYARALANAANTYGQAITAGREQLGVLTDQELAYNALKQIQDGWAKGFIRNDADAAASQIVLAKSIRDTSDRMQVLRSPLPGLTQLGLDASNAAKQIDTLGTTSLNNLANGLTDIESGTVTLSTGMKNLETQFVKSLLNMLNQMIIVAPIAKALQQTLGGFMPGLGLGIGGVNPTVEGSVGVVGLNGPIPTPMFMAGGGEMSAGGWGVVGERGPEIIQTMPGGGVKVHSNDNSRRMLSSGLPGFAGGGYLPAPAANGNQQQVIINNYSGAETKTTKRTQNGVDIMEVVIGKVKSEYGNGGFDGLNRARYGQQVKAKPR